MTTVNTRISDNLWHIHFLSCGACYVRSSLRCVSTLRIENTQRLYIPVLRREVFPFPIYTGGLLMGHIYWSSRCDLRLHRYYTILDSCLQT